MHPHIYTWAGLTGGILLACGWATSGPAQTVYSDIVGVQRIELREGRNFVGLPFATDGSTVEEVFGTNQLPAGPFESQASTLEEWDQDVQELGEVYWVSDFAGLEGWRTNGYYAAGDAPLDMNKGYVVNIRTNQGPVTLYLAGNVPTNEQVQVLDKNGFSLVSSHFPVPVSLAASGLVESGLEGGGSLFDSDNVMFYNPASGLFDQMVWYDATTSTWRNPDVSAATQKLEPGDAFVVWRRNRAADVTWTNPVPYTLP